MPYDAAYLALYEEYARIARAGSNGDSNTLDVRVFLPDPFIEVIRENIKLKEDIKRLRALEERVSRLYRENINLYDKLSYLADMVDAYHQTLPFAIDGTPN